MALPAGARWEVRTTGTAANGGFWNDRGGASTDYSQQDAAQASFTNLSTDGAGTAVTDDDAGGLFTDAMVGSGIKISTAWYEITARADGDNITIDRSAGASQSGLSGKVGGAIDHFEDIQIVVVAGNIIYIKAGTYVISGAFDTQIGTMALPIQWFGYNATRGDNPAPSSGNQPVVTCGNNEVKWDNFNQVNYLEQNTIYVNGVGIDAGGVLRRCKIHQTHGGAQWACRAIGAYAVVMQCEIIADGSGFAFQGLADPFYVLYNYVHDCDFGIYLVGRTHYVVIGNIIESINGDGISGGAGGIIIQNTIDGCGDDGIALATNAAKLDIVINNQITNNAGYGINGASAMLANLLDGNNYFGNSTDSSVNVTEGAGATVDDPGYADRAAGDFSDVDNANAIGIERGIS